MPGFQKAVTTKKGYQVMQKAIAGDYPVNISKIKIGNGDYQDGEDVSVLEDLKSPKASFKVAQIIKADPAKVIVKSVITNKDVTSSFQVKELGIFAQDPDEGDVLFAIAIAIKGEWDTLPAYVGGSPQVITVNTNINVSDAQIIYTDPATGVYVTADMFDEFCKQSVMGEMGVHGLRYKRADELLQAYDETEQKWIDVSTGSSGGKISYDGNRRLLIVSGDNISYDGNRRLIVAG